MRQVRSTFYKTSLFFSIMLVLYCAKHNCNPTLVEYLKAEKDLRKRISEEQGLNDSIKVLQQRYHIDPKEELSKLKDNPDTWLKLIKELKIEE